MKKALRIYAVLATGCALLFVGCDSIMKMTGFDTVEEWADAVTGSGENIPGGGMDGQNPPGGGADGQNPPGGGTDGQNPPGGGTDGQNPPGGGTDGQNPSDGGTDAQTPAAFTALTAGDSATTTLLSLVFDRDIDGLSEADITVTSAVGAEKGQLVKTGAGSYILLLLNGVQAEGEVTVEVGKTGYVVTPPFRTALARYFGPAVWAEFASVTADGVADTVTTTKLTLAFDQDIEGLAKEDIIINTGSTGAEKGDLVPAGAGTYTLGLGGVIAAGPVIVWVARNGYVTSPVPKEVQIHYGGASGTEFISVAANGAMGVERTTQLTFTFSRDIDGLSAEDITLDAGSTGAEKGDLVPAGTGIYTLGLNGVAAAGPVTAGIADSYNITPASRTVQIHYPTPIQAAFSNLTANGVANTTTTTELYLAFDKDIAGLGLGDIALAGGSTGATKSSFDRTGPGAYTLGISGVTAAGSVTVTVSKAGYIISDPAWTVQVHYSAASEEIQAAFSSLIANGSATTTSTTELYLAFDKDIDGLGLGDIALAAGSTGAAKSSVTKTSTGHYTLGISGVAATGSVTVTVSKSGYNITPASQTVQVYAATVTQATFSGLTANGSSTATTTELYLTFDKDITGLGSGDITLSGLAGVTKGSVTKTSTGKYTLGISGVTATGSVTVAVSKTGYVISNPTRSVQVYAVTQATFSGLTANGSSTATTTELYLTFDKDITSLGSGDITLSGLAGVTKGSVTKTNTGKYTLGISGVTASGSVTVAVSKSGYVISNPTRSVQVYYVSSSSGGTSYYVSASGNDTWDGQTATTPFKTLAKGYSSAMASSTRKRIVVLTNLSGEKITLDATSMPNKSATVTIEGNGSGIVIRRTSGTSDSVMEITGGGKVTFKQITINGKYASDVYHRAITVSGSGTEVTLDNGTAITGSIGTTGSTSGTAQGAGILVKSNGKLVLKAGSTVTNCVINSMNTEGNSGGGGIGVIGGGKLVMDGGTISGSTAYDGGGVMVSGSSSSFTMNNGTISGNTAGANGGGVHVRGASFSMTGGTISGNKAEKWRNINGPNGTGGGVYLYWGASFAMTGGTIYGSGSVTSSTLRNTVASSGAAFSNDANHSGTSPFSVKTVNTTIENGVILSQ